MCKPALALLMLLICTLVVQAQTIERESAEFLVKPYFQLGNKPKLSDPESVLLLWQTEDHDANWSVQTKSPDSSSWKDAGSVQMKVVLLPPHKPRRFYSVELKDLPPGKPFDYRVIVNNEPAFQSRGLARKSFDQPYTFAVFGDCGAGTRGQRKVANEVYKHKPDFILIPGDIVYAHGTLTEYMLHFFPFYNPAEPSEENGAPLLRSTLFIAAPGNHDLDIAGPTVGRDLRLYPDGLAYFYLWSQPLNGPPLKNGSPNTPQLIGSAPNQSRFLAVAGDRYPRMANFSYDYGNAHFLVLDADNYMDWTNAQLRDWVDKDLQAAQKATWRFVCFHQACFNSDIGHIIDQRMRVLADIFEKRQVDIVFAGHTHNYQRTYPLRFVVAKQPDGKLVAPDGEVAGSWTLDKSFTDDNNTSPNGVIYLVTGAGGAGLSGIFQAKDPDTWQEFTHKFIAPPHSFTMCDVTGRTLHVRQISHDGEELDHFSIKKP